MSCTKLCIWNNTFQFPFDQLIVIWARAQFIVWSRLLLLLLDQDNRLTILPMILISFSATQSWSEDSYLLHGLVSATKPISLALTLPSAHCFCFPSSRLLFFFPESFFHLTSWCWALPTNFLSFFNFHHGFFMIFLLMAFLSFLTVILGVLRCYDDFVLW